MTPSPWLEIQIKGRIKVKPTLDKIRQHMLEEAKILTERSVANDFILCCLLAIIGRLHFHASSGASGKPSGISKPMHIGAIARVAFHSLLACI